MPYVIPGPSPELEGHFHPGQGLGEICQHWLLLAESGGYRVQGDQEAGQENHECTLKC